jgi:hypothetical protein
MWAWAFACILVTIVCIQDGDHDWIKYVVIGWIIISCCFIGGKVIVDAFAEATRNAKIEANIGMPKMGGKT